MGKARLEAFSDGVLAVAITIMVLDLRIPHLDNLQGLIPQVPVFLGYALSFANVGIFWNNHHHMLHTVTRVTGPMLWANLHLLFWMTLVPFTNGWMGESHYAAIPCALYGAVLFMAAIAYAILQRTIIDSQGPDSLLRRAVGGDWKGKLSPLLYLIAIPLAFIERWISVSLYVLVALIWFIPDRRIERALGTGDAS